MNIHEYQAKEIFRRYGIPLNEGRVCRTPEEVFEAGQSLLKPGLRLAVKAQVHAGARGKAGGVKILDSAEKARDFARSLLGKNLVTFQTGPEGKPVDCLLVEATSQIQKEYYVGAVLDRSAARPCLILSESGGMEIEEIAKEHPSQIIKFHFSPHTGLDVADAEKIARQTHLPDPAQKTFARILTAVAKLFLDLDASLVEINPLGLMVTGELTAIDAKISFDDNALFRHPEVAKCYDSRQEDAREIEARKFDLSYVGLDGNIGCIVNGAGLAMATMDIIKYAGGEPANFLDVGGGASAEKVAAAFKIILQDSKVKSILVNIFGGIMRCDVVAQGIVEAIKEVGLNVPLVVRLEGTNVEQGKAILSRAGVNLISADSFAEAAEKVVATL